MATDANRTASRRFLDEVINGGNIGLIDELLAPGFVDHQAAPGVPPDREGVKVFMTMFRAAFPDLRYTLEDSVAEGDRVVVRVTARGTMKGEFAGMPPSGKTATWEEVHITRYANGKAVEHWGILDQLGMLQQLGFAQAPGQPAGATR